MKGKMRWLTWGLAACLTLESICFVTGCDRDAVRQEAQEVQKTGDWPVKTGESPAAERRETAAPVPDVAEGNPSAQDDGIEAKIRACFGGFLTDEENKYYETYDAESFAQVRNDDLRQWQGRDGKYQPPEGYRLRFVPADDSVMATQQMPQALLKKISTKELFSLILKLPGTWEWSAFDTYLQGLGGYYSRYNFMAELMQREDCAAVVHQRYRKYSAKARRKYSKRNRNGVLSEKLERFQMTEALEWFFREMQGKTVPDRDVLGVAMRDTLE